MMLTPSQLELLRQGEAEIDAHIAQSPDLRAFQEKVTFEELSLLDPQLAGLYRFGHELATRSSEPGVVYLLAHVGRELGRGVVRALVGKEAQVSGANGNDIPENERNRVTIGAVLQLPPSHASVKAWFRLNRIFSEAAHYRSPGPSVEEIRSAFLQFSELLFGRIAPYFTTHAELNEFLQVESPTAADIDRVRAFLVRPQQRRYFFTHLQHPDWFTSLEAAGYFNTPPDRIVKPDRSWRMQGWPEGEYLARIASAHPERVTEILLRIPSDLKNPAVWMIVIDAAKVMPAAYAIRLLGLLEQAFRTAPLVLFPHYAIDLVKVLAEQGEMASFRLAESWLSLSRDPQENNYELGEFRAKALPALETLDPIRTIKLFTKLLNQAIGLGQGVENEGSWWCSSLNHHETENDVRTIFAVTLAGLAKRTAQRDTSSAEAVMNVLRDQTGSIFTRVRYAVLEIAGPSLQQDLDTVIASGELLDPPFGAREATSLLRTQFVNASPDARRFFRYALERGPDAEGVKRKIMSRRSYESSGTECVTGDDNSISEAEIAEAIADWQRQRLGRFYDRIPPELQPLADRLGVIPQVPSPEDQALDEDDGGWAYGSQSPKTPDELASMEVEDVLEFLKVWRPSGDSFDSPSYSGLEAELTSFATEHPDNASYLIARGLETSMAPGYLSALMAGLRNAAQAKKPISWESALPIALAAVQASTGDELSNTNEQNDSVLRNARDEYQALSQRRLIVRATADLVREGCAENAIPGTLAADVWRYAEAAVYSPMMVSDIYSSSEEPSFDKVLMAAYNTVGGDAVRMLIDIALWDYRHHKSTLPSNVEQPMIPEVAVRLTPLLDHILAQQGAAAQGAHAMLGHFIPQLYLLAPEWALAAEQQMFSGGAEDPVNHPIWATYVTRARFHSPTFRQLRQWYVRAAEMAQPHEEMTGRDTLTQGLADHVIVGVIRGLCDIGDEDALVEKTFSNLPVKDRSHAYWYVFRGWSNAKEPVSIEFAQRIVKFWDWRLSELERAVDTPTRAQEADGLMWFLTTPYIPTTDAIRLGLRTIRLNSGEQRTRYNLWERLEEFAKTDAVGTFDLIELLVGQELAADYAYLPYERVAPALRVALHCDDPTVRARAERLVHSLGERGYIAFGDLLLSDRN